MPRRNMFLWTMWIMVFLSHPLPSFAQAPTIVSTTPAQNQLNLPVSTNISVTFDLDMDATTINDSTLVVNAKSTGLHSGTIAYDGPGKTATFDPTEDFKVGEVVTVELTTGMRSSLGSPLDSRYVWSFTVAVNEGNDRDGNVGEYQAAGTQIGLTTYDLQHSGTMGRQVAWGTSGHDGKNYVHLTWTFLETFVVADPTRNVHCECFDASLGVYTLTTHPLGGMPIIETEQRGGSATCDATPQGNFVIGHHSTYGDLQCNTRVARGSIPGMGLFTVDTLANWPGDENMYPITEVHDGTETVFYILNKMTWGGSEMILYRKIGTGGWDSGQYIETCSTLSYTVVSDPTSDNAAIVYTDDRLGLGEGEGGTTDLDVYYMLSTDQGNSWGSKVCVSNYTTDSLWRAYADLSALYTPDGELHIIWSARELIDSVTYEPYKCRLVHWSTDNPQANIVTEARYDMDGSCDAGSWNLYIAKMSVSWCEDKLYALWTQFGGDGHLDDCSQRGYANGDLYLSVSDDGGLTWDRPQNLTNTQTPNCDSCECESDHWSSMVRYGMVYDGARDTLDIIYINDKDPGAIPYYEGEWCLNPVMHLRVPCRDVVTFTRGDANGDGVVSPGDVVYLINYLFRDGPPPIPFVAGDANGDGDVGPGDIVYLLNYLFRDGPPPGC
jgi:hypothetical protein